MGRPLTALRTITLNFPAPGAASFFVSHLMRNCPLSMLNDSVCVLSRPDHDSMGRHPTVPGLTSDRGSDRHPIVIQTAATIRTHRRFTRLLSGAAIGEHYIPGVRALRAVFGEVG